MGKSSSQDIIESLLGRGNSAPEAFVRQHWRGWMAMQPSVSPVRRDAMLAVLAERGLARPALPVPVWPHWLVLLCGRFDGPGPRDLRGLRLGAAGISLGLHALGLLLLIWIALVRSVPPAAEEERVAVRLVARGQGTAGAEADDAPLVASPAVSPTAAGATAASPAQPAPQSDDAAAMAQQAQPTALPVPQLPVPVPALPEMAHVPMPALAVPERPVPDVAERPALAMPVAVPLPREVAVPDMPLLQVAERELSLAPLPATVVVPEPRPVDMVLPPLPMPALPEREVALSVPVPVPVLQPMAAVSAQQNLTPEVVLPGVEEREVELRVPVPQWQVTDATAALPDTALPAPGAVVREREVALVERAPMPALPSPRLPPALTQTEALPALAPAAVIERSVPMAAARSNASSPPLSPSAGAASRRDAASGAAVPPSGGVRPAPGDAAVGDPARAEAAARAAAAPAAGSGQDWSRRAAGSDDWSLPAGRGEASSNLAAAAARAAAPVADQWTRQGLAAAGTWLRQPPPGHQPGRFDRYWVPNESLLAEWVRKGMTNIDIPLPGGSGRIRCVISLLQAGGGCGVHDPNMQEQPAQARAAPDIPFKPDLQEAGGSL